MSDDDDDLTLQAQQAVLKTLLDLVTAAYNDVRGKAGQGLHALNQMAGVTSVEVSLPGCPDVVAKLSLSKPTGPTFEVTDEAGLLDWCRQRHPSEVVEEETIVVPASVRPAFVTVLLDRLKVDKDKVVDKVTDEPVPWAKATPPKARHTVLTFTPTGRAQIATAYATRALTVPQVLALPAPIDTDD